MRFSRPLPDLTLCSYNLLRLPVTTTLARIGERQEAYQDRGAAAMVYDIYQSQLLDISDDDSDATVSLTSHDGSEPPTDIY